MSRSRYSGEAEYDHARTPAIGVLFANLGTPDAATRSALRRYLGQFLWDPRVVEEPRWKWWLILHGIVLNTRPQKSAALYRRIWTKEGAPLLVISRRQAAALQTALRKRVGQPLHVSLGMRYGNPSIESALEELRRKGCRSILVFPAFPQYSAVTTASAFDAVADVLKTWRWVPGLRWIQHYHDDAHYVKALSASIRRVWQAEGAPERLLISFHGTPRRYLLAGDPYHCECQATARLLAAELGLDGERWAISFQSLFGKEEWLRPYTNELLREWGRQHLSSVDVVCPGFSADCLETIDEIGRDNREVFQKAGGGHYRFIPCLNDEPAHIEALCQIALRELSGWTTPPDAYDAAAAEARASATKSRAEALGARGESPRP
jgi:ferrochelatase